MIYTFSLKGKILSRMLRLCHTITTLYKTTIFVFEVNYSKHIFTILLMFETFTIPNIIKNYINYT